MNINSTALSTSDSRRKRLVQICESFPEVIVEAGGAGHFSFRIRKRIFAYYLFDHHGDGMIAFTCKSSLSEQRRLVREDPEFLCAGLRGAKRLDRDSPGPRRSGLGNRDGTCATRLSGSCTT